jgi:hypothetical protein
MAARAHPVPGRKKNSCFFDATLQLTENRSLSQSAKHFPNHYQLI